MFLLILAVLAVYVAIITINYNFSTKAAYFIPLSECKVPK